MFRFFLENWRIINFKYKLFFINGHFLVFKNKMQVMVIGLNGKNNSNTYVNVPEWINQSKIL